MIEFFVPGVPVQQGSKNAFGIKNKAGTIVGVNVVESANKQLKPWRTDVKMYAHEAMRRAEMAISDKGVRIKCHFVMKRPASTPKTRPTPHAIKRPDLDKLQRAIGDALSGTVYTEDSRVVEWHATKRIAEIGEQTGCHISVEVLDDPA